MNNISLLGWKGSFEDINEAVDFAYAKVRQNGVEKIIKEQLGTIEDIKKDYGDLIELDVTELETNTGDIKRHNSGFKIANHFFPHRFSLSTLKHNSIVENIENDSKLKRLIGTELSSGATLTTSGLISISGNLLNGYQLGNYCPGIAKYVYEKFCPYRNGKILDMSAGFGGRLVAAMSSKYKYDYTGVDPSTESVSGLNKLIEFLNIKDRARIIPKPFEDTDEDLQDNYFDVAFTSPPYFKKEIYADEDTQSWKRYPEYDDWVTGFLTPLIRIAKRKVKKKRYVLINVEDIIIGNKRYPVEKDAVKVGKEAGLEYLGKRNMVMSGRTWIRGKTSKRRESVFVFKKS
jgi:hypothetical protein